MMIFSRRRYPRRPGWSMALARHSAARGKEPPIDPSQTHQPRRYARSTSVHGRGQEVGLRHNLLKEDLEVLELKKRQTLSSSAAESDLPAIASSWDNQQQHSRPLPV